MSAFISKSTNSRPAYVRFRNHFDYKLFDMVHVDKVFKGKNDYLFYGSPYYMKGLGNKSLSEMKENVIKLKGIQDSLRKIGVQVLYAIAPEKMFVYPEFLPADYSFSNDIRFSYDKYIQLFDDSDLDYIDFNDWFIKMKGNSSYALFGKGGKHWTHYYAAKAADSIGDFLRVRGCKVGDFEFIHSVEKGNVWIQDVDTWSAANLPFSYEDDNIAEVDYKVQENNNNDDVVYLTDSYYHVISWSGIFKSMHGENSEFWYYNKERNDVENRSLGQTSDEVFREKKAKAYIILISVGNLQIFDFGFIDYFDEK